MPPPIFRKYRKNNLDFFMLDYLVQLKHVWQPWYRRWSRKGVKVNMLKSADSGVGIMGVARGGQRSRAPARFLEKTVIFCFERRFSTQNSVIRLKSNILAPPKFLGWLRHCPGVYICLSERAHLKLLMEGKIYVFIIYFHVVLHVSVNTIFKIIICLLPN